MLGSSLFSVGDLYPRLKEYSSNLGRQGSPIYFAKVDVQSAFDTIPQKAILRLVMALPKETRYILEKHLEIRPAESHHTGSNVVYKPSRKFLSSACLPSDKQTFDAKLSEKLARGKHHTVFVDNVVKQQKETFDLMQLLKEHVESNIVKIGKQFYRQKEGIPQGSILSSLLCNYFYADLEAKHLGFLQDKSCLLVRLIDDFLLITTDRRHAKQFLQVMHDGLPAYGVHVNPAKSLTNFEVSINGYKIPRLVESRFFPYCGNLIDTRTLNITKDRNRGKDIGLAFPLFTRHELTLIAISNALTVEFSKNAGCAFHRKVMSKSSRVPPSKSVRHRKSKHTSSYIFCI